MAVIDKIKNFFSVANKNKILENEIAYSVPNSNRSVWGDFSLLQNLSPTVLASILNDIKCGYIPKEYLEVASDIELKDTHYRSVLNTRKLAVTSLDIKVIATSDDEKNLEIAKAVERDIVKNETAGIYSLIFDMLDAIAKGFSVNEIIWESKNNVWRPREYKFRYAGFFRYDNLGEKLKLIDPYTSELYDLPENKFIIHQPKNHSGAQILSGLAIPCLFYFMLKYYDITSWAAFIDRFGYPLRLGKYSPKATEDDINTLRRAVASIGSDFGAVIPESAMLEIIESKTTQSTSDTYEKLAQFVNKEISKLVLGQTMTSEEGASYSQAQVHNEVRGDIAKSDIRQIMETLNSQLIVPYCKFNFGELETYPKLELFKPDIDNIELIINAVANLSDKGLKVKASEIRAKLGLSEPAEDDEVVGGRVIYDNGDCPHVANANADLNNIIYNHRPTMNTALNNASNVAIDNDYIEIENDIVETLKKVFDKCESFDEIKNEIEKLSLNWDSSKIAEIMASAFFMARAKGDNDFDLDEENDL